MHQFWRNDANIRILLHPLDHLFDAPRFYDLRRIIDQDIRARRLSDPYCITPAEACVAIRFYYSYIRKMAEAVAQNPDRVVIAVIVDHDNLQLICNRLF